MKNKDTIIADLNKEIDRLQPERKEALEKLRAMEAKISSFINRKKWIECPYRYGDIVEFISYKGETILYVALSYDRVGRRIKKDGTLYAESTRIRGGWRGKKQKVIGRYDGRDLPEPNEAARFGIRNR